MLKIAQTFILFYTYISFLFKKKKSKNSKKLCHATFIESVKFYSKVSNP